MATGKAVPHRSAGRLLARAGSNICLGLAAGLLGYYLLTDAFTAVQQRALMRSFETPGASAQVFAADTSMDFSGWERQDRRYWSRLEEGEPFARIQAPAIGLDRVVVKGVARADLMKGPGWIPYSDLPGLTGNCGISGHRTTYGAPFRHIDRLRKGDAITLRSPYRVYTYRVERTFTVTPDRVDVVKSTQGPILTLTACHPPFSARQRLIVQARLESVVRIR